MHPAPSVCAKSGLVDRLLERNLGFRSNNQSPHVEPALAFFRQRKCLSPRVENEQFDGKSRDSGTKLRLCTGRGFANWGYEAFSWVLRSYGDNSTKPEIEFSQVIELQVDLINLYACGQTKFCARIPGFAIKNRVRIHSAERGIRAAERGIRAAERGIHATQCGISATQFGALPIPVSLGAWAPSAF